MIEINGQWVQELVTTWPRYTKPEKKEKRRLRTPAVANKLKVLLRKWAKDKKDNPGNGQGNNG